MSRPRLHRATRHPGPPFGWHRSTGQARPDRLSRSLVRRTLPRLPPSYRVPCRSVSIAPSEIPGDRPPAPGGSRWLLILSAVVSAQLELDPHLRTAGRTAGDTQPGTEQSSSLVHVLETVAGDADPGARIESA